jgi:hypothetical protein
VEPAPSSDDTPQDRRLLHSPPIAATGTTHLLQLLSSAGKNGSKAYWPKTKVNSMAFRLRTVPEMDPELQEISGFPSTS